MSFGKYIYVNAKFENIVRTIGLGSFCCCFFFSPILGSTFHTLNKDNFRWTVFRTFFPNCELLFIWTTSSLIFTIYLKCVCEVAEVSFLGLFFWAPEGIPLCEILELGYDNKVGGWLPAVIWFPLAHGPHL